MRVCGDFDVVNLLHCCIAALLHCGVEWQLGSSPEVLQSRAADCLSIAAAGAGDDAGTLMVN